MSAATAEMAAAEVAAAERWSRGGREAAGRQPVATLATGARTLCETIGAPCRIETASAIV